jgi:hypothetical protein
MTVAVFSLSETAAVAAPVDLIAAFPPAAGRAARAYRADLEDFARWLRVDDIDQAGGGCSSDRDQPTRCLAYRAHLLERQLAAAS